MAEAVISYDVLCMQVKQGMQQECTMPYSGSQRTLTPSASSAAYNATVQLLSNPKQRQEAMRELKTQLQLFQQPGKQR